MAEQIQKYIGTKIIHADPATRGDFKATKCIEAGWEFIPEDNDEDPGYMVIYPDGYVSWSPEKVFEEAYRPTAGCSFGLAIEALKKGFKVTRAGWNGKGMWLVLMGGLKLPPFNSQEPGAKVNDRTARFIGADTPLDSQPYIAMWTAEQKWQPGWLASQADMLADDWMILDVPTEVEIE